MASPDRQPEPRLTASLPTAILTLAAVVCLSGVAQARALDPAVLATRGGGGVVDRDSLGQLVAAIASAARKLSHEHQPALCAAPTPSAVAIEADARPCRLRYSPPPARPLRDELTHLPPPAVV